MSEDTFMKNNISYIYRPHDKIHHRQGSPVFVGIDVNITYAQNVGPTNKLHRSHDKIRPRFL
jgi:hypothetical protein